MWRGLAIVVALTGCGRLFGIEPPVRGDDDGTGDGGVHDDAARDGQSGDANTSVGCPNTYNVVFGVTSTRYRIVTSPTKWPAAQAACLADQLSSTTRYTHLIVGASDIELSALDSALPGQSWIGLSDRAIEAAYQWVTQETNNYPPASGDPWATDEPKANDTEDCVMIDGTGDLVMQNCDLNKPYVCECDAFMNDPTKY